MPEDIRGLINITPTLLRIEEPGERLPHKRARPVLERKKKAKKDSEKQKDSSHSQKGRYIDVRV